jgi:hypothetical protein
LEPAIQSQDEDAPVLAVLTKHAHGPILSAGMGFKAIWILKNLAKVARRRVQQALATGGKKRKAKKIKPQTGALLLKRRLEVLGLSMKKIEGDGNCQFRAVSDQLYGTQDHHQMVSQQGSVVPVSLPYTTRNQLS